MASVAGVGGGTVAEVTLADWVGRSMNPEVALL